MSESESESVVLGKREGLSDSPLPAELAFRIYRRRVEKVARRGNENACAVPLLWVGFKDELIQQKLFPDIHPLDQLGVLVWSVHEKRLPSADWIVFMTEGYSTSSTDLTHLTGVERGELQDRHRIGMSGVDEGVWGHMAHRDGRRWLASQTYERDDRALRWQRLHESSEGGGQTMRLLLAIVGRPELALELKWPTLSS